MPEAKSGCELVELKDRPDEPADYTLLEVKDARADTGSGPAITWSVGDPARGRRLHLQLNVGDGGTVEITGRLHNDSDEPWQPAAGVPALRDVFISTDPGDAWYLLGTRNTVLGRQDIDLTRPYGGPCPLPLADLFAERVGGGLGIFTVDPQGLAKSLRLKQAGGKSEISLRFDHLNVPAHESLTMPTVVMMAHAGDWHDAFELYRRQARRAFPSRSRLGQVFYCRRDYPLGGTGYLFDLRRRVYTPQALAYESSRMFGGLDMIDISGWAYNEQTGRVGSYLTNDLGGLDAVRRMTGQAQQAGSTVGLYFEGYLIDRRCELAGRALPAWQLMDKGGKGRWWSGEIEFFTCPGVKAWREELAGMIAEVARRTGVDAVYVDQFGISTMDRACWSPDHDHPVPSNPLHEERLMLESVRRALAEASPKTALYIEYVPPECMMELVDAAFDISMYDRSPGQHPSKLLLHRYAFPELAAFQMVGHGIRPIPFEVDDLHRSVFHGVGLWLKGRGASWFTSDFHQLARKAQRIFAEHGEVFRSADCEPLVPTLHRDVYANRFASGEKTIYTVYNAGYSTVSGNLLEVAAPRAAAATATELVNGGSSPLQRSGDKAVLRATVEPWSTAVFLLDTAERFTP